MKWFTNTSYETDKIKRINYVLSSRKCSCYLLNSLILNFSIQFERGKIWPIKKIRGYGNLLFLINSDSISTKKKKIVYRIQKKKLSRNNSVRQETKKKKKKAMVH